MAARATGTACVRFENGFLPDTTQMDAAGVNAESSVPREPAFYRERGGQWQTGTAAQVVPRAPRRGKAVLSTVVLPPRYVFIPFQVMLDSQVLLHSPWLQRMDQLYTAVTEAAAALGGEAPVLVFKEHPSCPQRYPALHAQASASGGAVLFANGNATGELIAGALGVITLNSSVGVESLLLGKPVLALGNAVYGVPGVAESARSVSQIGDWLRAVAAGVAPPAPLREAFLHYLAHDHLLPDRHQAPGAAHIAAARRKLAAVLESR
jgi:capsular polysaccharide export protein